MDKNSKKALRIGVFYDGRPGHEKQPQGILDSLSKRIPISTTEFEIERKTMFHEVWDWLWYFLIPQQSLNRQKQELDLLIGTGSRTHIPMLGLKKKYDIPVTTAMSPSPLLINRFDLCFVPVHDGLSDRSNVFQTIGPPNVSAADGKHDPDKGLILIGGIDEKSHYWNSDTLRKQLLNLFNDPTIGQWTVTSSPRTPKQTCEMVEVLVGNNNNINFFPFEKTEKGWVEQQYNLNKYVWVTADSMSMVYEALSAGCHVGLLPVQWKKKKSKFRRSEDFLIDEGFVISFDGWMNGKETRWPSKGALNEADRCAQEIIKRLIKESTAGCF